MPKLDVRSDDVNSVIVADMDTGYAVAQFFYQRGKDGKPTYDAFRMAEIFIAAEQGRAPDAAIASDNPK